MTMSLDLDGELKPNYTTPKALFFYHAIFFFGKRSWRCLEHKKHCETMMKFIKNILQLRKNSSGLGEGPWQTDEH